LQGFYELYALLVGLCVGSFLNVVIARVPAGESIVSPGSRCPRCHAPIRWFDNVPVFAWLLLRGRCRACRASISVRYPIVELATGLLAVSIARAHPPGLWAAALFVFVSLLVAVAYIDLDHWIIPHVLTWPGIVIGVVSGLVAPDHDLPDALWGALGGYGFFGLVALVGSRLFKREALGQGDWWLLGMIGAFLGWRALLPVVLLASLQGSVVGVLLLVSGRAQPGTPVTPADEAASPGESGPESGDGDEDDWVPPKNALPFGPFLALAALEQLFLGEWLYGLYESVLQRLLA
jgi:leader peptidase (prepilin peptidase)/N-methyltransferase